MALKWWGTEGKLAKAVKMSNLDDLTKSRGYDSPGC